jgi:uncharacterized BrkB/YihY/UPF0761 family membrane protein
VAALTLEDHNLAVAHETAAEAGRFEALKGRAVERLERYEGIPVIGVGVELFRRDVQSAGSLMSSAVAFRLFLFFVPLLLLVVGLAGFVGSYVDPDDLTQDAGLSGGLADQIGSAFTQSGQAPWLVTGLGLVGLATTGRSLGKVLMAASRIAWGMPTGPRASWRVIGSVAGLTCSIGLVAIVVNRARTELGLGVATLSIGVAFAVYAVAWLVITGLLPRRTEDPGALLPGAFLFAALLAAMQAVSQLYLPDRFDRASQLYGAIGATVVTLGWFFLLGRAVVLSMELNAVVYERHGSLSARVFSLPVLRVLPRRSARVRRFFDLD